MHWTILVLCLLTFLCAAGNAAHWILTRTVRTIGILICSAWAVQQGYWWAAGEDSIVLFVVCDAAVIAWFLTRKRRFDIAEKLIAATIPLTTALGVYAWLRGGHTATSWWANWWLVAGQMTVSLPFVPEAMRRVKAVNRHFNPWEHFDLRARHGDAT
jgi:hypothetical protein